MNAHGEYQELTMRMRGRLLVGVPILAAFACLTIVWAGVQVHAFAENHDSIEHWTERQRRAATDPSAGQGWAFERPEGRIRALEEKRAEIAGIFVLSVVMSGFFGVLAFLGGRTLKRGRRRSPRLP